MERERVSLNAAGGRILFRFQARDVHLVLRRTEQGRPVPFRVLPRRRGPGAAHGVDIADADGNGHLDEDRLYQLVRQPEPWKSARSRSRSTRTASRRTFSPSAREESNAPHHLARLPRPPRRTTPLTRDFPVLSAGPTPHTPLEQWDFSIVGEVDEPRRWTWEEFRALPSEEVTVDIHCVTKWSKLDTVWQGVSVDTLLDGSRRRPSTSSSSATAATRPTCRSRTSPAARRGSRSATTASRSSRSTAARRACSSPHLYFWKSAKWVRGLRLLGDGRARLLGDQRLPQLRRSMARAAVLGRLTWRVAEVVDVVTETPRVKTIAFDVPGWPGHRPGQHVDVRLTAEDGYQAQRSYSIASAPDGTRVELTVERLDDGEVSPYLTDELRPGDQIELRGPVGGYFVWEPAQGGPLLLVAGGSGVVPLMAMIRAARRRRQRRRDAAPLLLARLGRRHLPRRARAARRRRPRGRAHADAVAAARLDGLRAPRRRRDARRGRPEPGRAAASTSAARRRSSRPSPRRSCSSGTSRKRVKTERFGPTGG